MKIIFVLFDRRIDGKGEGCSDWEAQVGIGLSTYRDSDVIFGQARSNPKEE
jgi:hypothetical protein